MKVGAEKSAMWPSPVRPADYRAIKLLIRHSIIGWDWPCHSEMRPFPISRSAIKVSICLIAVTICEGGPGNERVRISNANHIWNSLPESTRVTWFSCRVYGESLKWTPLWEG